ncbi:ABC transporter permease subunit [Paractinoplanes globisporus]|uniref:ABC transporter permease subunit n=1 Tax=Paractinoplanes globisporus TaxID=113565 RepID=A0ABW6WHQ1_9ACTN|nr:ABC transporter permease subunit [Actinoplanes globisporus]
MTLRAEWTKFISVRGWARGIAVAALLIAIFPVVGLGGGGNEHGSTLPIGPDGEPVSAAFYFVHRALSGDGQITVAVTGLTSVRADVDGTAAPWAKAGLIITSGPAPGSRYAAVMATGGHGIRMQHDYLHDRAGPPGAVSASAMRWLRLTRAGEMITGEASTDGRAWSRIDTVRLPGLATTVQAGLFVACPPRVSGIGTASDTATAEFGSPQLAGSWSAGSWAGDQVGAHTASFAGYAQGGSGGFARTESGFTVTGAGDLAPATRSDVAVGAVASDLLVGTFPALIVVVVVATLMITTEYRYGLIRSTLSAGTRRGRVLAAKATVIAGVTFIAGLLATVIALPLWLRLVRGVGVYLFPAAPAALLRAEVGTAVVLAVTAVFALAVGTILRRSATAVTTVVAATVLPYFLALIPFLPPAMAQWLTRFTPAAALAVQQTVTRYPQVDSVYTPANGYYPLPPWAGLAVLCGYTTLALAIAVLLLRRRDA